ncbi:MAG: exodeoxyribonuclease VII large subunit [Oscillibacter sp.]|nr:exodeoxyribonuclease VII large subunit [Oscillibacter sp.]
MEQKVYSVSEINQVVKRLLDNQPDLKCVYVRGELSNYKMHPTGHYFSLKDADGVLSCVMYPRQSKLLRFRPENGMKVILRGRISLFPRSGAYQLYCETMTPEGAGELALAFAQLKARLYKEGLFDPEHKKPLPRFPERIALITAATGDAVHDMIRILRRRYPLSKVLVLSVRVQGPSAPESLVRAIRYANQWNVADLIITGRGGGSMEELWAFNDEQVARAIYDSEIPIISAVGHEPDETIADYVADIRASTPSHAAELAVPDQKDLQRWLRETQVRLEQVETARLAVLRHRLNVLAEKRVLRDQMAYVQDKRMELLHVQQRIGDLAAGLLVRKRQQLSVLGASLDAMSPLKVLGRGYAMAQGPSGNILRSWKDASAGEQVTVTLGDGGLRCTVEESYERKGRA